MTRTEALIGLNMASDIGSIRLKRLLDFFGAPQDIFKASVDQLIAVSGIGRETAERICFFKEESLNKEIGLIKKHKINILTIEDNGYPENLKEIPGAPIVLYVKGELLREDKLSIAIVGSRRASFYGLSLAGKFAVGLAEYGITIISGMARGIDTYAHKGALKRNGRTIAVMGSGFNQIYPYENKGLAEEIANSGAVISEFSMDTMPLRQNFPRRNRIISGLSSGVLVVEAAKNSGALITADFALEQGRDVFALPGKIDSPNSLGTNELIKQGAKLVSSVEDIIEEFNPYLLKSFSVQANEGSEMPIENEEAFLYDLISEQPIYLDEIIQKANLEFPTLSKMLLELEMRNLIRQLPGKQFIRRNNER